MGDKLAFFAPFQELAELVRSIAVERNEDILVIEGQEGVLDMAKELERKGIGAIISRGPMVNMIRRITSTPVICCDPAGYDLLKAFSEARQYDRKVGFITSFQIILDRETVEDVLGITIEISRPCKNRDDIYREVVSAAASGLKVVVGGSITYEVAPIHGLKCIKLFTGRETVIESIEKAKEIARVSREKQAEAERFRIILDLVQDGIVSMDKNKVVTVFNPAAEEMTGLKRERVIGKPIDDIITDFPLMDRLKSKKPIFGELVSFGNVKAVNNRVPIVVRGETVGVVLTYQDVTKLQEIEAKVRRELNKKGLVAKFSFDKLLGDSKMLRSTLDMAKEYAKTNSTILIVGETGCGKELLAQSIHLASPRRNGPFVAVNCSALPENLLESELFGYEEGAFTGARRGGKQGLFELAHRGTIFLDEIAGTTLHLQSRLLRVVEEKEVMRVGGDQVVPLDVRIIASSNRELRKAVNDGTFRADLFYRLNVLSLRLPPLRERTEDISILFRHFLGQMGIAPEELENIMDPELAVEINSYHWPGNVRELEHFAEKVAVLYMSVASIPFEEVQRSLMAELREKEEEDPDINERRGIYIQLGTMEEMETDIIRKLFRRYHGNKSRLARQLNISRTTLWKRLDDILNDGILKEE
ncbi:MAG: sigma 54-interacting transcriptional regulator [Desulfocucumaceae bacterium]